MLCQPLTHKVHELVFAALIVLKFVICSKQPRKVVAGWLAE